MRPWFGAVLVCALAWSGALEAAEPRLAPKLRAKPKAHPKPWFLIGRDATRLMAKAERFGFALSFTWAPSFSLQNLDQTVLLPRARVFWD